MNTGEEVWKKMEPLRDQRRRLLKKVKDTQRSGAGSDDVFKPALWWFELLSFLDADLNGTSTTDNLSVVSTFESLPRNYYCHKIDKMHSARKETVIKGDDLKTKSISVTIMTIILIEIIISAVVLFMLLNQLTCILSICIEKASSKNTNCHHIAHIKYR